MWPDGDERRLRAPHVAAYVNRRPAPVLGL